MTKLKKTHPEGNCDTCEYEHNKEWDEPCFACSHNFMSKWKPKKPSALDEIRAEIENIKKTDYQRNGKTYDKCIEIIDKYREGEKNDLC